jgi:hypothetical protein
MPINKNYILWSLIATTILIGIFLILRQFVVGTGSGDLNLNKNEEVLVKKALLNPPEIIQAIYLTSISGGSEKKINWLIELANKSELNAVVIDIKDFSGYIAYNSEVLQAEEYKTERIDIKDVDLMLRQLHEKGVYVIARMTVFQDPALVRARPDWAVKNKYTGKPWADRKGLSWIDPTNRQAWEYYSAIAKDAIGLGFDEINFDYIRFPSDGDMSALVYSSWLASPKPGEGGDESTTRPKVLNEFFKYVRGEMGDAKISADLFGFVTTRTEDFGVGQVMEDAFEYFDFISPMVYPSHYPPNFLGFANPAEHPYEVIYHTMKSAGERLVAFQQKTGNMRPSIRPWLQDFKLGADYTQAMVQAQIKATQDALGDNYKGFMLWNARNVYHEGVFE